MSMSSSTRLNIAVVDPGCLTPAYDSELCQSLAGRGHQVTLVTAPYQNDRGYRFPAMVRLEQLFFRNIRLLRFPRLRRLLKGLTYARDYGRFVRRLAEQPMDVVHVQWLLIPPLDFLFLWRLKRRFPQTAVIVTVHDVHPLFRLLGASCVAKVLRLVDGVIVHGESARTELLRMIPRLHPSRLRVVPHGPLHQDADTAALGQSAARAQLGIAQDRHVALFFGELKAYKGLDLFVQALAGLGVPDRERLTVVVAGKLEDDNCTSDLARIERLPIDTRVDLGYVPTETVAAYFQAADVVVLPYKAITQSGILLTALANGRPVIATDVGELPTVIQRTDGGWVVPAEDPLALRNALRQVLRTDRRVLAQTGARARQALENQFGWDQIASSTLAFYQVCSETRECSDDVSVCSGSY